MTTLLKIIETNTIESPKKSESFTLSIVYTNFSLLLYVTLSEQHIKI
jgi:hypothetical protein